MRSIESIVRDGRETTVTCTCCRGTGMMAIGLAYPHTLDALTSDWRTLAQILVRFATAARSAL